MLQAPPTNNNCSRSARVSSRFCEICARSRIGSISGEEQAALLNVKI